MDTIADNQQELEIRILSAEQVRDMRHTVLRPHQPASELIYPKDDHPMTFHLGGYIGGKQIGIASFLYDANPDLPDQESQYRIRGMATLPEHRGNTYGKTLLEFGLANISKTLTEAPEKKTRRVWCNAREVAFEFYLKCGFVIEGDSFDIPGIGPHKVMWREV